LLTVDKKNKRVVKNKGIDQLGKNTVDSTSTPGSNIRQSVFIQPANKAYLVNNLEWNFYLRNYVVIKVTMIQP
jgi:hypothetical protein